MASKIATFSPETGLIDQVTFLRKISEAELPIDTNNKKISYYNVPAAFDIEVSSFYYGEEKQAAMYIWQFGILNWVTYGRTWDEFLGFMHILSQVLGLSDNLKLIIYVHNLAYEWQFMRKLFHWDKVFLLDERKPVYAISGGYEFRCSLKLSSKSLAKVGEDLVKYHEHKHIGDLDYQLIRFHSTPLTKEELGYCEADIRVLLAYIQEKIETDGSICYIPLTNTGYVRNACRKACFGGKKDRRKYKHYRRLMQELTLDAREYAQLKRGFQGGFVHACARYAGKLLEEMGSFDFISAYPAVLLLEYFPMSKSKLIEKIESWEEFNNYIENYCCLFDATIRNVRPKVDFDHPLSVSKLILPDDKEERKKYLENIVQDNGRVVFADEITTTFTEKDWLTFCSFYDFGDAESEVKDFQIHQFRIYERGYIPKDLALAILEFYKKKTTLKDVEGEEINYMIFKNMLNACYGMMVTDIVRDILEYDYDISDYKKKRKPNLEEAIDTYNNSKKRFLFYPWGVWVTSHCRYNLFSGILACGKDYVYSDTDSIKILNPQNHMDYIESYNKNIMDKIDRSAKHFGIDSTEYSPKNKKGIAKTIGLWEYEGMYKRFKTIGAKRYLIERYEKDINIAKGRYRYSLTTAGVNKSKACAYLEKEYKTPFDGFTHNLCVPKEYSGRLTLTYIDKPCYGTMKDYLGNITDYHEESYIHMEPSEYNLTMSEKYRGFLNFMYGIKEDSW